MIDNVNTREYWDRRFAQGDWERKGGFTQTALFAHSQIPFIDLPASFSGSLCDFGCGAGDAFPVYRAAFPKAELIGVDFSLDAIRLCEERHGRIANFVCGDHCAVPKTDVVIASNVLEHISDDEEVARQLSRNCRTLYVIVPFDEEIVPGGEHLRSYTRRSFASLAPTRSIVFPARGWSEFGNDLWTGIHLKNLIRPLLGRKRRKRAMQIMFQICT